MKKTLKQVMIVFLTVLTVALVFAIIFYKYIPTNKRYFSGRRIVQFDISFILKSKTFIQSLSGQIPWERIQTNGTNIFTSADFHCFLQHFSSDSFSLAFRSGGQKMNHCNLCVTALYIPVY